MVKSFLQKAINVAWNLTHNTSGPSYRAVDDLDPYAAAGQTHLAPFENSFYDGEKFGGGFGTTQVQAIDYWTLRQRSAQLFNENLYARGIVRRLITNEINTGLTPEAAPDADLLGIPQEQLAEWTEITETRFDIWSRNPQLCDWKRASTFGAIQRAARLEALVSGDVLIVLRQDPRTRLPLVQLVSGDQVQTPLTQEANIRKGHEIREGVELDAAGRVVAHWVRQDDLSSKRIPAFGEKTGRRKSWLIYGTDRRLNEVRGQPLLSLVLQSLKEIDRYRDSAQRKAVVASTLVAWIKKAENKIGSLPFTNGAAKRGEVNTTNPDGTPRKFNLAGQLPGLLIEELQQGEEPVFAGGQGTDINFGEFEKAILQGVAWALEIPPEVLMLSFSNNYSASQAAINELKIAINRTWGDFGETFCQYIYTDWLTSEVLLQKIKAPGFLEAQRNPGKYDVLGAWTMADWYGSVKLSTDMLKQAKGSKILVEEGWSNNARESRVLTGTKFSRNMKRILQENKLKVEAARPLAEFQAEFGPEAADDAIKAINGAADDLLAVVEDMTNDS